MILKNLGVVMLRFAPSPTGDMHIGNLRVALFNFIMSKQLNEELIIRIEDTDKERNIEGKDKEILDVLNLFNIEYSQVIHQSSHVKFHRNFAIALMHDKKAFNCFCSTEQLEMDKKEAKEKKIAYRYLGRCENLPADQVIDNMAPFTVRLKKPLKSVSFTDKVKGKLTFEPNDIDSIIILRQDKNPTYNFACACDDILNDISLVIRGEDHVSNTPKQIAIRDALKYEKKIEYAHLPIILDTNGQKMSKRDNASSIKWLLSEGFLPEAISNYLILIGNKPPVEVFTLKEALEWFDLSKISKSPAKFDIDKLRFLNREHMKRLDNKELSRYVGFADDEIGALAKIYIDECNTLNDLREKIKPYFEPRDEDGEFGEGVKIIKKLILKSDHIQDFNDFKEHVINETGLEGKNFLKPLRIVLTNSQDGPELAIVYPLIKNFLKEIAS